MQYDAELRFLCSTLQKSGINIAITPLNSPIENIMDKSFRYLVMDTIPTDKSLNELFGGIEPFKIYKLVSNFEFCYLYFLLPDTEENLIFLIGPYVPEQLSSKTVASISSKLVLSTQRQSILEKFCAAIPIIPDNSPIYLMIDSFCERIWENNSFSMVDINAEQHFPASPINHIRENESSNDILLKMQVMEKRYAFENELLKAVSLGHINKANILFSQFSEFSFEKRVSDQSRNMKNYCIVTNTLLRKAAESGGVHPIYLDSISTDFAVRIEKINSVSDVGSLMREMFRSYCRLVRKHSTKNYSPLIQNAIVFIESDLSADLSLSTLASALKVSSGYLSTAFKRETEKTVTEFIREKRIKHAMHLLTTTKLQIQTIALNCGIMDLQYFSKLFKRHTGMTPKEYRENIK